MWPGVDWPRTGRELAGPSCDLAGTFVCSPPLSDEV